MLTLNKLFISSFGKFNNTNINLENRLNIIIGDNEAGKSTIHRFIKSMFYGFAKPETARTIIDQLEYMKYKPWFNDSYHGSMEILYNNDKYLIYHNFNTDIFEVRNLSSNEIIDFSSVDSREIGNYFLDMNSIVFDRLLNIQLINLQTYNGNNEFLKEYLLNNYYGNLRDLEINTTVTKLNSELDRIGTDRVSNKEMGIINRKINILNEKLSELYRDTRSLERLKTERIKILNYKKKSDRIYYYTKRLYDYNCDYQEEPKFHNNNETEDIDNRLQNEVSLDEYNYLLEIENYLVEAISYKKEILKFDSSNKYQNINLFLFLFFIAITNIIVLFSKLSGFNKIIFVLISLLVSIIIFYKVGFRKSDNGDKTIEINSEIDALNIEIERLEREKTDILNSRNIEDIKEYLQRLNTIINSEIDNKVILQNRNSLRALNFTPLVDMDLFNKDNLDLADENLLESKRKLSKIDFEIETLENSLKNIRQLNEQLKELHNEKNTLEKEIDINKTILDAIKYASAEFSKKINFNISSEAGKILSFLTDKKYTKLIIDDNLLPLIYDNKLNNFIQIESLSTGTIQTVYLALSIAFNMSRNSENNYPLILDEVTNHLDFERREQVLNYLSLISKDIQVIYFSNSSSDVDILKNLNADYNIIRI